MDKVLNIWQELSKCDGRVRREVGVVQKDAHERAVESERYAEDIDAL